MQISEQQFEQELRDAYLAGWKAAMKSMEPGLKELRENTVAAMQQMQELKSTLGHVD